MKLLLPIILVAFIAFAAGLSVKNSFVASDNLALTKEIGEDQASGLEQMTQDQASLSGSTGNSAAAAEQGTTHSPKGNTYTSQNLPDKVVMNGKYMLSTYKINFSITLPKNGGDISGALSGTCEGKISGKAEKPDGDGESTLTGEYSGDCKPIPTLGFKTHASGSFTGIAKFKQNKAEITVSNKEPFSMRNWFEMYF